MILNENAALKRLQSMANQVLVPGLQEAQFEIPWCNRSSIPFGRPLEKYLTYADPPQGKS